MSVILGILTILCGFLAKKWQNFKVGVCLFVGLFAILFVFGDNKYEDSLWYFFALGISQVILSLYLVFNAKKV